MDLELREGSHLYSAAGDDLGTVRQFVVKPSTGEVTHVLVEKGVFFTDDHVVPVETLDHTEDEKIFLSERVDPATLPRFVREHFTPIDDETRSRLEVPTGYMWRYPTTYAGPFPIYPTYPMPPGAPARRTTITDPQTREAIAEQEIISKSTPVLATNGEKVGTVSEVQVDEDGQLNHLVVDLGFLSDEKVLPAHWIERIASDGVTLAVSNVAVESLESIT